MVYYGYFMLAAILPMSVFLAGLTSSWAELVPVFSQPGSSMFSSDFLLGLNQSLFLAFMLVPSYLTNLIADILGRPWTIRIGLGLCCLGQGLSAIAPNMAFLLISRPVIVGIGMNFCMAPMSFLLDKWFPWHHRFHVFATSFQMMANPIGFATMPLLIGYIISSAGWRYSFIFLLIFGVFLVVFTGFVYREPKPEEVTSSNRGDNDLHITPWRKWIKMTLMTLWFLTAVCKGLGQSVAYTFLVKYAEDQGFHGLTSTYSLTAFGVTNALSRFVIGLFGDFIKGYLLYVYAGCALMLALACFLIPLSRSLAGVVSFGAVLGAGQGPIIAAWYAACHEVLGGENVRSLFLTQLIGRGIGLSTGGILSGLALDKYKSYTLVFNALGLFYGIILVAQIIIISCNKFRNTAQTCPSPVDAEQQMAAPLLINTTATGCKFITENKSNKTSEAVTPLNSIVSYVIQKIQPRGESESKH